MELSADIVNHASLNLTDKQGLSWGYSEQWRRALHDPKGRSGRPLWGLQTHTGFALALLSCKQLAFEAHSLKPVTAWRPESICQYSEGTLVTLK